MGIGAHFLFKFGTRSGGEFGRQRLITTTNNKKKSAFWFPFIPVSPLNHNPITWDHGKVFDLGGKGEEKRVKGAGKGREH